MKFGICSEIFKGWDWDKTVNFVSDAGYDGIEIAPFTFAGRADEIPPAERRVIAEKARSKNIEIIGLHWLLVSPGGLSLTSPDEQTRRKTASYMKELTLLCSDLGGKLMVLGSPGQRRIPPGSTPEEARERAAEVLEEVLSLAAKKNVCVLIEPLSPAETDFINTAEDAVKFINETGHPNLRLHLDVKAMASERKPVPDIIRESGGFLAHFHANDPNLKGPGAGKFDYAPVREALEEINYRGYVSVEVFDFSRGPENTAIESLRYLKKIFPQERKI